MEKDVNKLMKGHKKFIGRGVKVQKRPVASVMTLSKSELK